METNYKKVTQALNWLAKKEGGEMNKMKAIKLIWMADRLHLRNYGRPITNDEYLAMKLGPVGSLTRNITDEATPYLSDEQLGYSQKYIKKTSEYDFRSINDVDGSVFSASDLKTLETVYANFGKYTQFQLADFAHEFPEWKKFEKELRNNQKSQAPMSYDDFFGNPDENSSLLKGEFSKAKEIFSQDSDTINSSREAFDESQKIQELWS